MPRRKWRSLTGPDLGAIVPGGLICQFAGDQILNMPVKQYPAINAPIQYRKILFDGVTSSPASSRVFATAEPTLPVPPRTMNIRSLLSQFKARARYAGQLISLLARN